MMPLLQMGEWEEMENIEKAFADRLLSHISYLPLDVQLEYCLLKALLLFSKRTFERSAQKFKTCFFKWKNISAFTTIQVGEGSEFINNGRNGW